MLTHRTISVLLFAAALHAAFAAVAQAWVPWTNSSGSATYFDWENGGSDNGRFGDPALIGGDTFVFVPDAFRAESINGQGSVVVGDRLQVDIHAHTNVEITSVSIQEIGDYAIYDGDGDGEQVALAGSLIVSDLDRLRSFGDPLVTTPGSPITSGNGTWTADAQVDLFAVSPLPAWTNLTLILDNDLVAITNDVGEVAWIQKKAVGTGVAITIIPEPGTLTLLALGGLAAMRRRRS